VERHQILVGWAETRHETPAEKKRPPRRPIGALNSRPPARPGASPLSRVGKTRNRSESPHHLRSAERPRQPAGPSPAKARDWPGSAGGRLYGAIARAGRRFPGDSESRRDLHASRSRTASERLGFLVRDSRLQVALAQEKLRQLLPGGIPHLISLDRTWHQVAGESDSNPSVPLDPLNLAYVIYTSVPPGSPKALWSHTKP